MTPLWHLACDLFRLVLELAGRALGGFEAPGIADALLQYFLNSLWQGTLLIASVALALRLFPRVNAATRHSVWCLTIAAVIAVPLFAVGPERGPEAAGVNLSTATIDRASAYRPDRPCPAGSEVSGVATESSAADAPIESPPAAQSASRPISDKPAFEPAGGPRWLASLIGLPARLARQEYALPAGPWKLPLLCAWFALALLRLARLANGYRLVWRIRDSLAPLAPAVARRILARLRHSGLEKDIRLAHSDLLPVPAVVGFRSPVVVLPGSATASLSPFELDAVGLHEAAHVQRRDHWYNLAQRIVECFLFFHPAVMWVCRRLTLEREIACDDWVVAATGRPRPYAACLARLVECAHRSLRTLPVTGAALTRRHIFRRIEALLTTREFSSPRVSSATIIIAVVLLSAAAFQIGTSGPRLALAHADSRSAQSPPPAPTPPPPPAAPRLPAPTPSVPAALPEVPDVAAPPSAVPDLPPAPPAPTLSATDMRYAQLDWLDSEGSVITHDDDGQFSASWSDGRRKIRVVTEGEVTFAGDTGVASVSREGYFRIEERNGRDRRELEVVPGRSGELEYYYAEGGRSSEYDEEAKAWFARALPEIMRRTGLDAEGRVQRIFQSGGADAVMAETDKIESNYVRRLYFEALLKLDGGTSSTVQGILRQVVGHFDSDYETAELLVTLAPYTDADARAAYFQVLEQMDSDYEIRRVLSAIGNQQDLDPDFARAAIHAAGKMDSDYEKAELLIEVADLCRFEPRLRSDYLAVLLGMDSDYEKRRTLSALGDLHDTDPDFLQGILEVAGTIESDYERAELLIGMSRQAAADDRLLRAYVAASAPISSDYEKRRALAALPLSGGASEGALLDLLDAASGIDSDYEKAEFYLSIGPLYGKSERLDDALREAVDRIDSDYERDRVGAALWRHQHRSRGHEDSR